MLLTSVSLCVTLDGGDLRLAVPTERGRFGVLQ